MSRDLTDRQAAASGHSVQAQPDWSKLKRPARACHAERRCSEASPCRTPQACALIAEESKRAPASERVSSRFVTRLLLLVAVVAVGCIYWGAKQ